MQIGFLNLIIRITLKYTQVNLLYLFCTVFLNLLVTLKYTQVCQIRKIKLLPGNYRFLAIKGADRK